MRLWIAALTVLTLSACGDKDGDDTAGSAGGGGDADTERAEQLYADIAGFETWGQTGDWIGIVESADGTHGAYVQIWVNTEAEATITAAAGGDMPDGAIIVKRGYDDDAGASEKALTVMEKDSTYGGSGWFWAQYGTDGSVSVAGEPSGCTGCHGGGQDSVLYTTW